MIGNVKTIARDLISWDLFSVLFPLKEADAIRTPLALRETIGSSVLLGIARLVARTPPFLLVLLGSAYVAALIISRSPQAPFCFNGLILLMPLLLLVPSLLLWALPLGLALAPVIARERESKTWEVLRATPLSTEEILRVKTQGALWSLRRTLHRLWYIQIQVIIAIAASAGGLLLLSGVPESPGGESSFFSSDLLCFVAIFLLLLAIAAYFFDRIQQFMLMAAAALASSAAASSVRTATTAAITAVFLAWGVDMGVGIAVMALQPGGEITNMGINLVAMTILGPVAGYVIDLNPGTILIAFSLTLLVRHVAIRELWKAAVRGAEQL